MNETAVDQRPRMVKMDDRQLINTFCATPDSDILHGADSGLDTAGGIGGRCCSGGSGGTLVLIMTYAMLIPATGRRAAVMVCRIALIPAAVDYGNRPTREWMARVQTADGEVVSELRSRDLLELAVGAGFAIYGTVVISRLRRRAEVAEELSRYRLREKLGGGGMGEVFLAQHKLLRRLCAVKLIRSDQADDPRLLASFEREVQATASLTHWTWALAEHWWLTCLPDVVEPRPGRPSRTETVLAADTLSSDPASRGHGSHRDRSSHPPECGCDIGFLMDF